MTWEEAKAKLQKERPGEHQTVTYGITTTSEGREEEYCELYVSKVGIIKAGTWEQCFELLANGRKVVSEQGP